MHRTTPIVAAAALALLAPLPAALAGGGTNGITYQGRLQDGGGAVDGTADLVFRLYDAASGGALLGTDSANGVSVDEGVFNALVDFGANPFADNGSLWLEIDVRTPAGAGAFTTLSPRQALSSTPRSLSTRGIDVTASGNVGIGTDAPQRKLHVRTGSSGSIPSTNASLVVESSSEASISLIAPTNEEQSIFFGNPGTTPNAGGVVFNPFNGLVPQGLVLRTSDADRVAITEDGLVGVNTSSPKRILHVWDGESGSEPSTNASLVVESDSEASISLIAPTNEEQSIFFGNPGSTPNAGGVVFNPFNGAVPQGLVLRTDDADRVAISQSGLVGIGTSAPERRLHVSNGNAGVAPTTNSTLVVESDGESSISVIAPPSSEASLFFGNSVAGPNAGAIVFNPFGGALTDGLVLRTADSNRLAISAGGNVGINTLSPSFRLEVNGTAGKPGGGSWSVSSDARLKRNVHDLEGALDTLLALRGVTFEYVDPTAINELPGERIGFIAQEVETVVPDWISERRDGYKALTIRGFEALAVEALRELETENRELRDEVEGLRAELDALRAAVEAIAGR